MRELTADTIIRVRAPLPLPRKRELTGDTRIKLSQIVDLKDWALEFTQDEAAPEGTVHHWSDGDHIKKNGKWVPVENKKIASSKMRLKENKKESITNFVPATKAQKKKLEKYSCTVDVAKIDTKAIEIVDVTVKSLIKEYKMRPLEFIKTVFLTDGTTGQSDGNGIYLNEDFYNDPKKYYNNIVRGQEEARVLLQDFKKHRPKKGKEKEYQAKIDELELLTVRDIVLYEGKEIESTTLHEMAHVLSNQRLRLFSGEQTPEMIKKEEDLKEVFENAKLTGEIDKISQYARKNHKEFFAEAFVVYKLDNNELPGYIKEMIERIIK